MSALFADPPVDDSQKPAPTVCIVSARSVGADLWQVVLGLPNGHRVQLFVSESDAVLQKVVVAAAAVLALQRRLFPN